MNPARRRRSDQQHLRSGSNPKQPETSDSLGMNPVGPRLADLDTFDTRITVGVRNREERPLRRAHDEQRRAMSDLLITQSTDSYQQTVARLERELANRGLDVFARIDHAANARTVGLRMPATLVITSGSRLAATPLMVETPDLALDLPLRVRFPRPDPPDGRDPRPGPRPPPRPPDPQDRPGRRPRSPHPRRSAGASRIASR